MSIANGASFLSKLAVSLTVAAILAIGGSFVQLQVLENRVAKAEEEIKKSEDDHDRIIRIETTQTVIKEDVETIKKDLKATLEEIRNLGRNRRVESDTDE